MTDLKLASSKLPQEIADVIPFEDPKCFVWAQEEVKSENTGWVDKDEHHKKKDQPKKRVRKPKTKIS